MRLTWASVPAFGIRPHGGFEHGFLSSARGAMILIRNLEGEATTIVATSPDGVSWEVRERPSSTVPSGHSIHDAQDWLQLMPRADGGPGFDLVASSDGQAWETRSRLLDGMEPPWADAVNGETLLVCGGGQGVSGTVNACALSRDVGRTWERVDGLESILGWASIRDIVALGDGFLVAIEGNDGTVTITSPDGSSWTRQPDPVPSRGTEVGSTGTAVVITAPSDTEGVPSVVWATRDGVKWQSVPLPPTTSSWLRFVRAGTALVATGIVVEQEGSGHVTDILVSADGLTWRADAVPSLMLDRLDPEFLTVQGGVVAVGDPVMLVGRVIPATDPGPAPQPAGTVAPTPASIPAAGPSPTPVSSPAP